MTSAIGRPVGTCASRSAWNRPMAPVRLMARKVALGLSTVKVCSAFGGMVTDDPGPRSKPSSSICTIIRPCST